MSASESDAAITTAASVGCGRLRSSPGTNSSISAIASAPTSPVTCVLRAGLLGDGGPRAAGADREALEEARRRCWRRRSRSSPGCRRPPRPLRPANADAVEIVSASETSAMPSAAPSEQRDVGQRRRAGTVSGGKPCGSEPTSSTPCSLEVERRRREDREDDRRRARSGPSAAAAAGPRITTSAEHADGERRPHGLAVGDAVHERPRLVDRGRRRRPRSRTASAAGRSRIVTARPFM